MSFRDDWLGKEGKLKPLHNDDESVLRTNGEAHKSANR
jgi:hypothetical protein